jgi:DNA-binding NarL/FixJ family response regulator
MQEQQTIKVAMADDHVLLRHALAALIDQSDKSHVILQASTGRELCENLKSKIYQTS